MRDKRQVLGGIITVLVILALIIGAYFLSLAEGNARSGIHTLSQSPTLTLTPRIQATGTRPPTITLPFPYTEAPRIVSPTSIPSLGTSTLTPSLIPSGSPTSTLTLFVTGTATLSLTPTFPIPPIPTHTQVSCGPPSSWIIYIVQRGDTLYHLGQVYGIPYRVIQRANCLPNSTIYVGQRLFVPPWATRTPSPTIYIPFFPSDTPTETWTDTPTETPTPTP